MRGAAPGLVSPHPLVRTMPALYQDDDLTARFCAALDQVLAPVVATLDCFPAYLDPGTAPSDLLPWLARWVGVVLHEALPEGRRRDLVAAAATLHAWRGTTRAVRHVVHLATGIDPEVVESGATAYTTSASTAIPGEPVPRLLVRAPGGGELPLPPELLADLVAMVVPAHIPWPPPG